MHWLFMLCILLALVFMAVGALSIWALVLAVALKVLLAGLVLAAAYVVLLNILRRPK